MLMAHVIYRLKEFMRKCMLRKDANVLLEDDFTLENPELNTELSENPAFGSKFDIFVKCIKANAVIAPIRWELEEQIRVNETEMPVLNKKKVLQVV